MKTQYHPENGLTELDGESYWNNLPSKPRTKPEDIAVTAMMIGTVLFIAAVTYMVYAAQWGLWPW